MDWEVRNTKIKTYPTLLIKKESKSYYLHSKYDPIKEAKTWVESFSIKPTLQEIIMVGVGLGYHVSLFSEKYPHLIIHVFEFNYSYMKWLLQNNCLTNLIHNKNIIFHHEKDTSVLLQQLSILLTNFTNDPLIYKPSLVLIEQDEIRLLLESFLLKKRTILEQGESLKQNFDFNLKLKDEDINRFIGCYSNSLTILVSAGPSLTKQIPLLKIASNQGALIACVGTVLSPLVKAGIKPNLIMISDPKDLIIEQFLGLENMDIPLFYLSTANHGAVKMYKGPRYIVWQKGFEGGRNRAKQNKVPLIETGGSVATCLLDLLVKLGSKKIALVGQDLAFTNNLTHAIGTHSYSEISNGKTSIEVDDYYGKEKVRTSRNLYIYLKWFERYVEQYNDIQFWNCTEGGAYIKGWKHRPLSEFLDKYTNSNGSADCTR